MDSINYILFICMAIPVALMILPIDKQSRKVIIGLLIGMYCCLFVGEINGFLLNLLNTSKLYITTNVTPITEEIVKVIPILFYEKYFSTKDKKALITFAFAVGVGFAMLENAIILVENIASVNLTFAMIRGFASGLMHSVCTIFVAYFISFMHTKKKMFICGTICAINLAMVYHSVFNLLVQAEMNIANYIGYVLPIITYLMINGFFYKTVVQKMVHKKIKHSV